MSGLSSEAVRDLSARLVEETKTAARNASTYEKDALSQAYEDGKAKAYAHAVTLIARAYGEDA